VNLAPTYDQLAPPPDFRYVGLHPGRSGRARVLATAVGLGALGGAALGHGAARGAVAAATVTAAALALEGLRTRARPRERAHRPPPSIAIVPWGILVESEDSSRILRWAAVERVHLSLHFGRDGGTPTAKDSFVTVETTGRESFTGRAFGAVALERLVVHLEAYAREAAHRVALDLDGAQPGEGPDEPEFEPILLAAQAWVQSAGASKVLALPPAGYRWPSRTLSRRTVEVLREVLRDRTPRMVDPRPFAAVVAVELGVRELAEDLVALVQSPHPLIAAVAKVAARKLGVARSRVGALDEVAPFLLGRDLEALNAWGSY